jgi:hypothetical protein
MWCSAYGLMVCFRELLGQGVLRKRLRVMLAGGWQQPAAWILGSSIHSCLVAGRLLLPEAAGSCGIATAAWCLVASARAASPGILAAKQTPVGLMHAHPLAALGDNPAVWLCCHLALP